MRALARQFGTCQGTIRNTLERCGVERRHQKASWRDVPQDVVEQIAALWLEGALQVDLAEQFGIDRSVISRLMWYHGIPRPPSGRGARRGEAHQSWKGGRTVRADGYVLVRLPIDDPLLVMANSSGYAVEHRLVMARALGRPLRSDESVHHLNGDRQDNRPENLQLRQAAQHGKGVVMQCQECGSHNVEPVPIT